MRFDTAPTSGARARRFISDACQRWSISELIPDAQLVVTELVENAIRHGRTAGEVTVRLTGAGLWVGVWDGGSTLPRRVERAATEPGGRGILMIDEISREWGVDLTESGKTVWALLALPADGRGDENTGIPVGSAAQMRKARP